MAKREIRPIRVDGQVAYVPLTKGYTAIIDAADLPLVDGVNWGAMEKRRPDGTIRAVYAKNSGTKRGTIFMHRLLVAASESEEVDHVDCDGLNNRRINLRIATTARTSLTSAFVWTARPASRVYRGYLRAGNGKRKYRFTASACDLDTL